MRAVRDPVSDLRSTVATLQAALDRAHARVRELEHVAAAANQRAAEAVEYADAQQMREAEARAAQSHAEVSP